jgi:hypothetical protein
MTKAISKEDKERLVKSVTKAKKAETASKTVSQEPSQRRGLSRTEDVEKAEKAEPSLDSE